MPPALRHQRAPTAGDTPAPTAASSVEHPAAIAAQNSWRSSRRATEGRPGEGNAPRPDRSERRFRMAIATSSLTVLRRPLEPRQDLLVRMLGNITASQCMVMRLSQIQDAGQLEDEQASLAK